MTLNSISLVVAASLVAAAACGGDDGDDLADAQPVIDNYAVVVLASYTESRDVAAEMKLAIDAFIAAPSADTLLDAQDAWLAAREPYGETEAYRFYDGPIDDPDGGPEGLLNAWPLDEAYVDYVIGNDTAGIINDPVAFPSLSAEIIAEQNEKGAEENISTGYHAIEFLLWGQDVSVDGPGERPFTDYLTVGGTNANQARRGEYLGIVTDLVITHLDDMIAAWSPGQANYAEEFRTVGRAESIRRILQGMGSLSGAELSGERMGTALDNRDQEDEHSCFSDNTHRDLRGNAIAIQNVWLGRFGGVDGVGLDELVRSRDPALADRLTAEIADSIAKIEAIPVPFDQAIDDDAVGRPAVQTAIDALKKQTDTTVEIATLLGITINLE